MEPKCKAGIIYLRTNKFVTDGNGKVYRVIDMERDIHFKHLKPANYKIRKRY